MEPCSLCSLHIKEAPAMCQGHKYRLHSHIIFLVHEPLFLTFITKRRCLLCLKIMSPFPFPDRKCFSGMLHWSIQNQKQARETPLVFFRLEGTPLLSPPRHRPNFPHAEPGLSARQQAPHGHLPPPSFLPNPCKHALHLLF